MILNNNTEQQQDKLTGSIERITYHNSDNGFCVLRVKVGRERDLITVTGNAASVTAGEYIEAQGSWLNDKKHGLQFKAEQLRVIPPSTLEGIQKYLSSGMVKGIGPHFAKILVQAFGEQVFDIIENEPEKLSALPGIGAKRKETILHAWSKQKVIREIMIFLQSHGLGTARAVRIYKTYGQDAIARVMENPYRLALDIHGIGFKSADNLAQQLGIAVDSPLRAQAGVRHCLQLASNEGHCCSTREKLIEAANELLTIDPDIISAAIDNELENNNLMADEIDGAPVIFLTPLFRAEQGVAAHLHRLLAGLGSITPIDSEKAIPWVEEKNQIQLSPSQHDAVRLALKEKVLIITGGPGVGKTTIIRSIVHIMRAKQYNITLCAPTGRAAKRLSEATGMPAKTIHRTLDFNPRTNQFNHDAENPLLTDLIVIDEISMVDVVLMNQLLRAIKTSTRLLMVGDSDQLPSVGPGAVLANMIASDVIATVQLNEIFRQAATSQIIVNAHRLNQGQLPIKGDSDELSDFYFIQAETPEEIEDKLLNVVLNRIPQRFGFNPIHDIQILTPTHRSNLGAHHLNQRLQAAMNPLHGDAVSRFGTSFTTGDKVIQTVNNYDKEVFNGDMGIIERIDAEESALWIQFDQRLVEYEFSELDEISLAYAITIHKSQGSEYPVVVIPLAMQHYMLLARNLVYTAVTRGKKLVIIIGQVKALATAIHAERKQKRLTKLTERLQATGG
jgi:exodeoxyribonuclease V alpha subunit